MHPILLLSIAAILIPAGSPPPQAVDAMHHGGGGFSMWGGCPGNPGLCEFGLTISDPNLIFFRWDFNGDGRWDSGGGPANPWVAELRISFAAPVAGFRWVSAHAWDGITTVYVAPYWVPIGPVECKSLLLGGDFAISPSSWDRASTGDLVASWTLPAAFFPDTPLPKTATVAGVPATPMPTMRIPGRPIVATFGVDRTALTAALGPGTHYVRLWGIWDEKPFTVLAEIEFSADGQVTIM